MARAGSRLSLKTKAPVGADAVAAPAAASSSSLWPPPPDDALGVATLRNLGSTCFLNALLQLLRRLPELSSSLHSAQADGARRGGVLDALCSLLDAMGAAEEAAAGEVPPRTLSPLCPAALMHRLRSRHASLRPAGQQQCALETLSCLLHSIEEECEPAPVPPLGRDTPAQLFSAHAPADPIIAGSRPGPPAPAAAAAHSRSGATPPAGQAEATAPCDGAAAEPLFTPPEKRFTPAAAPHQLFTGAMGFRRRCLSCECVTVHTEPFRQLSLPLPPGTPHQSLAPAPTGLLPWTIPPLQQPQPPPPPPLPQPASMNGPGPINSPHLGPMGSPAPIASPHPGPMTSPDPTLLEVALSRLLSVERLRGRDKFSCSECQALCDADRSPFVSRAPQVMVLHLQPNQHLCGGGAGLGKEAPVLPLPPMQPNPRPDLPGAGLGEGGALPPPTHRAEAGAGSVGGAQGPLMLPLAAARDAGTASAPPEAISGEAAAGFISRPGLAAPPGRAAWPLLLRLPLQPCHGQQSTGGGRLGGGLGRGTQITVGGALGLGGAAVPACSTEYELVGFVAHCGRRDSGHYVAYVREIGGTEIGSNLEMERGPAQTGIAPSLEIGRELAKPEMAYGLEIVQRPAEESGIAQDLERAPPELAAPLPDLASSLPALACGEEGRRAREEEERAAEAALGRNECAAGGRQARAGAGGEEEQGSREGETKHGVQEGKACQGGEGGRRACRRVEVARGEGVRGEAPAAKRRAGVPVTPTLAEAEVTTALGDTLRHDGSAKGGRAASADGEPTATPVHASGAGGHLPTFRACGDIAGGSDRKRQRVGGRGDGDGACSGRGGRARGGEDAGGMGRATTPGNRPAKAPGRGGAATPGVRKSPRLHNIPALDTYPPQTGFLPSHAPAREHASPALHQARAQAEATCSSQGRGGCRAPAANLYDNACPTHALPPAAARTPAAHSTTSHSTTSHSTTSHSIASLPTASDPSALPMNARAPVACTPAARAAAAARPASHLEPPSKRRRARMAAAAAQAEAEALAQPAEGAEAAAAGGAMAGAEAWAAAGEEAEAWAAAGEGAEALAAAAAADSAADPTESADAESTSAAVGWAASMVAAAGRLSWATQASGQGGSGWAVAIHPQSAAAQGIAMRLGSSSALPPAGSCGIFSDGVREAPGYRGEGGTVEARSEAQPNPPARVRLRLRGAAPQPSISPAYEAPHRLITSLMCQGVDREAHGLDRDKRCVDRDGGGGRCAQLACGGAAVRRRPPLRSAARVQAHGRRSQPPPAKAAAGGVAVAEATVGAEQLKGVPASVPCTSTDHTTHAASSTKAPALASDGQHGSCSSPTLSREGQTAACPSTALAQEGQRVAFPPFALPGKEQFDACPPSALVNGAQHASCPPAPPPSRPGLGSWLRLDDENASRISAADMHERLADAHQPRAEAASILFYRRVGTRHA